MGIRIGIVGTGWVGSSVAISTLHSGVANELLLFDLKKEIAEGEAMDLRHGVSFYPTATVRTAALEEMRDVDAVVIAAGLGGKPGQTRLDLVRENAQVVLALGRSLAGFGGIVVVVTNPVDILTQLVAEASGLPPERVLGTGTMLDTARLRQAVGRELHLDSRSVHAQVVGEHGDSEVVLWSGARVGGTALRDWPGWSADHEWRLGEEVRTAAYEIIRRKGATNHAIGLVTAALLRWMLRGERRVLTVSRVQEGALGLKGVALSLPTVVGRDGAVRVIEPRMSPEEEAGVRRSAELLRRVRASL